MGPGRRRIRNRRRGLLDRCVSPAVQSVAAVCCWPRPGGTGHRPTNETALRGQAMMRLRRASVIVSLALLLSAATAAAQGKYLLWSYFTLRDGEYWQANYAFESKKECKAVAAAVVLREAARRGNTITDDRITTASGDLTPICLRDTVDPRGPK